MLIEDLMEQMHLVELDKLKMKNESLFLTFSVSAKSNQKWIFQTFAVHQKMNPMNKTPKFCVQVHCTSSKLSTKTVSEKVKPIGKVKLVIMDKNYLENLHFRCLGTPIQQIKVYNEVLNAQIRGVNCR